jgi:pimeloyl-ACP methyl ester carboxylesterase
MEDGWDCWRPLARRLGPSWRIFAIDLPWRAGNCYRWRRRASAARWVADGLTRIGEPVDAVIGHSFGANAVLELLTDPTMLPPTARPAAVALAAPFYRPPDMPITGEVFDRSRDNFDRQIRAGVAVRLGRRITEVDPEVVASMMDKAVQRISPAGFFAVFDQFVTSGELVLSTVDVPTLVLAGRGDPGLGRRRAAVLAEAMPAATVVVSDDYDHFCHVRQVDDVARRVTDFLYAAGLGAAAHERSA